jgi:hypothetical protein
LRVTMPFAIIRTLPFRLVLVMSVVFLFAPRAAHADGRDVVEFGDNIVVHAGDEVHDTVCFFCTIEVDGTVHGDMVAILGNIRLRGHADRDAVVILGSMSLGENASVDRDAVVILGSLRTATGATIGNDRVVIPTFVILFPLLIFASFIALIIWAVRAILNRPKPVYPMPPPRY